MKSKLGIAAFVAFIATIWLANWAVEHWGVVGVGFGLVAPAGVYFAAVAFTLRDTVHRNLGRAWVLAAIALGALVSYLVSDGVTIPGGVMSLALASGIAFAASELADLAVYTPIRRRGWLPAVAASNAVGLVADSALFLWLAFGSEAFLKGQVVGKAWMTLAAIGVIAIVHALRSSRELELA